LTNLLLLNFFTDRRKTRLEDVVDDLKKKGTNLDWKIWYKRF